MCVCVCARVCVCVCVCGCVSRYCFVLFCFGFVCSSVLVSIFSVCVLLPNCFAVFFFFFVGSSCGCFVIAGESGVPIFRPQKWKIPLSKVNQGLSEVCLHAWSTLLERSGQQRWTPGVPIFFQAQKHLFLFFGGEGWVSLDRLRGSDFPSGFSGQNPRLGSIPSEEGEIRA